MPTRRPGQLALYLAALAAGAGLAFAVASAGADEPMSASITAKDPYSFDNGSGGNSVSIANGGTVTFSYPSGGSFHNVVFDGGSASCSGLPADPASAPWSGSCTFAAYGTYTFHCELHPFMTGKVEVPDPNAPPPTGTTGPTTPTTGTETQPTGPSPGGGEPASPVVKVAKSQRGVVVRGSVTTPDGPSSIAVTAFVAKKVLSVSRARPVRVGSVRKHSTGTGKTAFALRINRSARRALHRRHRLPVSLRIVITPDGGYAVKKTAAVTLRERP